MQRKEVGKDLPEEPEKSKATKTVIVYMKEKVWEIEKGDSGCA